jgi:excisionase family DNA binding protein
MKTKPSQQHCSSDPHCKFVNASQIAKIYSVVPRYILKLAAEGRIPSLRVGKKCVRFNPDAVAKALEGIR